MLILILWIFFTEILPRAQRKEDLVISAHIPTSLDAVSVSDHCTGTFLKYFFRTCSYKIISGVFRNHIHLLLLILPSTKNCQYNLKHAVCECLYPQQSAIDDSEESFPSITVTVRQHINLLTCSS